jgi:hypothetical protein
MELDFSKKISESKDLSKMLAEQKSRKQINDLPDSDFAYIEPGGSKDESGRTVPRSLRHLPIMDCAHVRNALARLSQTKISADAKASALKKIKAAAKKCKIEVSESEAKDWEKTDEKELKRDDKKEKKEHHKDAVKDDESKLKKLKKEKPSEKKSVETHDLKKDIKYDKKKESEAASDKQKAAKEKFLEMIRKKKGGDDKDDEKDGDKKSDDKKSDDKKSDKKDSKKKEESKGQGIAPLNNIDFEEQLKVKDPERMVKTVGDDEEEDEKELKRDDKKEKKEHEKDAIKDDKKQVKDLKKDEKEDEKALEKSTAPMNCPECY